MKAPLDGWEPDELEVLNLEGLADELEAVRARSLPPQDVARLLARIQKAAPRATAKPVGQWRWGFALATAAGIVIVAGTIWMLRPGTAAPPESVTPPAAVVASAPPAPAPVFRLALEKPGIKVSPAALAWRGPGGDSSLLADLKPAFDAFRADDFRKADREFQTLSAKYPTSIEVLFYQGVARLFLNDVEGATASLTAAERSADSAFAWDVAWYRAIADERAGNPASARARLTALCKQPDARANSACEALTRLPVR